MWAVYRYQRTTIIITFLSIYLEPKYSWWPFLTKTEPVKCHFLLSRVMAWCFSYCNAVARQTLWNGKLLKSLVWLMVKVCRSACAHNPLTYPLGKDPETCLATEVHFHLIHHGQTDNQKVITVAWHHHTLQEDRVIEQCRREDSSMSQGQGIMNARCLPATGGKERDGCLSETERERERERGMCIWR